VLTWASPALIWPWLGVVVVVVVVAVPVAPAGPDPANGPMAKVETSTEQTAVANPAAVAHRGWAGRPAKWSRAP